MVRVARTIMILKEIMARSFIGRYAAIFHIDRILGRGSM
jgi:hypothetical protein